MFELSFIWAGLIAFAVLAYVLLDGFDLGIGILFPFLKDRDERHLAMNTIAPVWGAAGCLPCFRWPMLLLCQHYTR